MVDEEERLLIYFENEAHLVRRLGAAVLSCWAELPTGMRERLVARAEQIFDETETDNIEDEMNRLINAPGHLPALV